MKKSIFLAGMVCLALLACRTERQQGRTAPWTEEQAHEWFRQQGWLRGCNFQPSTAINQLEMWQAETFDPATISRELSWAATIGMNCMRVYLHHVAWEVDQEGFKQRMGQYLDIADRYGISTIFVFFDDCWNPTYAAGRQPAPQPGVHNSGWVRDPGDLLFEKPELINTLEAYMKDVLTTFKDDKRIALWDLYNEPGNSGYGEKSLELLKKSFEWAWQVHPSQPLSAGLWSAKLPGLNRFQLEHSDVITYHDYTAQTTHRQTIDTLKKYGRPMICTEYMARHFKSTFQEIMPVLKDEQIGAINWGLVAGKTQTFFKWSEPLPDMEEPPLWFTDIFRKDGTPYIQEETDFIRSLTNPTQSFVEVIPQPHQTRLLDGAFDFNKDVNIICSQEINDVVSLFNERLSITKGLAFTVKSVGGANGNITLKIIHQKMNPDGYTLTVQPAGIRIEAAGAGGIFYGLQTLQQMILDSQDGRIPACCITDKPRFAWRGLMLDASRTFLPVNFLKRYIDLLAAYKMNVLHLHLTDDQGWRMEIKKYPRLTTVGSKFTPEANCMGGFYTQDEMRDLIRYASQRNVMIVPEIEMPGHACAAIAAYPFLSCTQEIPVIHTHLEGPDIHEEVFCAGSESTYQFIFNVIDEIIELFPSKYIHVGADEVPKAYWEKCPLCQKTMRDNGLKNENELQSFFINKVGKYLESKGRTLIGWDEILDGGMLSGNETIMFWRTRNTKVVEEAINTGFKVICTPRSHCYFDYRYTETGWQSAYAIDTRKIQTYEPVMPGTAEENYLGVQANFWSHIDRSEHNIDKQLFPRLLGLAETAWSFQHRKDWTHFKNIARRHLNRLKLIDDVNVYPDATIFGDE